MRRDFALSEPLLCRIKCRDEVASSLENLGATADCVPAVDQIENRVDAIRVSRAQRVDHIDSKPRI